MLTLSDVRATQCAAITVNDAAALLGVDRRTLSSALSVHGGDIPAHRVGRRIVIPRAAFLDWYEGRTADHAAEPATPDVADNTALIRAKLIELLSALEAR